MSLPDRLPTHVGQPQPLPGWPTEPAHVELYQERPPIAWVQDPHNPSQSVAIDARLIQPPAVQQPRDLAPVALIDPLAARMAGGGVLAAGVGYGGGQLLLGVSQIVSVLAGAGTLVAWLAIAAIAARVAPAFSGIGQTTVHQTTNNITNHNRWLGKSSTNL